MVAHGLNIAAALTRCARLCAIVAALALVRAPAQAQQPPSPVTRCSTSPIGATTIVSIRDGGTLIGDDGREIRLAGLATPADPAAKAALDALATGQTLRLEKLGADSDRYGRVLAFAYPANAGTSLQEALLAQGLARVSARIGAKACAEALLTIEHAARAARRGLWADPNFAPLRAENLDRLKAERGHFALIEGKVLSVRESGATIYANFGRRWTRDFTVIILKRQQRTFTAAGLDPKSLEGHRIRVRGTIEQRGGPVVMADVPEQIELID